MRATEKKIVEILRKLTWPDGIVCPDCRSKRIYRIKDKTIIKKYTCLDCLRRFSDISETIFHRTHLPLIFWLEAFNIFFTASHFTARKLKNDLSISYMAARRMKKVIEDNHRFVRHFLKYF